VSPKEFILLLLSVIASFSGQAFLKLGALRLGKVNTNNAIGHVLSIVTTPELMAGLVCYALGAIFYILLLTRVKLSVAAPASTLIYIFSVLFGYFVLHEALPSYRLMGLGLIVCGVILVAWQR